MRLRSNCKSHTRSTRRTLRMALAVAIASSSWASVSADSPLPVLPGLAPSANSSPTELLPYPFGHTLCATSAADQGNLVDRDAAGRQLIKLLGLQTRSRSTVTLPTATAVRPQHPLSVASSVVGTSTPTPLNSVVMASATSSESPALESQSTANSPTLPTSPTLPALATQPKLPTTNGALAETTLSESFLDIEIPSDVAIHATQLQGIVQPCEPPSLAGSESIAPTTDQCVTKSKQPELVRATKPLIVASASPSKVASRGPTTWNLNDSSDDTTTTGRGAVLHLSSGSDAVDLKANTAPNASKTVSRTPMQVRIEGEPAPVLEGFSDNSVGILRPAAPMPMMDLSTSTMQTASASKLQPVKAVLASRKTPTAAHDTLSDQAASHAPQGSGQPLTVGLQASNAISTEYSIAELSVEHPNICQLLKTSDRSVSVIGMRPGTTRIALISYDSQGERQVDVREVSVGESAPTEVNLPTIVKELSQTVKRMYPKSDVQIIAYEDYVMVRGYTNYESDAKKILSLVRKTSLAPVVDQLTTSEN